MQHGFRIINIIFYRLKRIGMPIAPSKKQILVITDNRHIPHKEQGCDLRDSGFRDTQFDFQDSLNNSRPFGCCFQDLNLKLAALSKRVDELEKNQGLYSEQGSIGSSKAKYGLNPKRHRRTFAEITKSYKCLHQDCQKLYGTQTALRKHERLKHGKKQVLQAQ